MIKVSIIIPTYNKICSLESCLQSLYDEIFKDKLGAEFEVIVVDDGSTDLTESYLPLPSFFKMIHQKNRGPATARNTGAQSAKGAYLAFMDDDCRMTPEYSEKLFKHIKEGIDILGGPALPIHKEEVGLGEEYLIKFGFLKDAVYDSNGELVCFPSANLVIRKKLFFELGGFDERFRRPGGEDNNLLIKAIGKGFKIEYDKEMALNHDHESSIIDIFKRWHNYGSGNALNQSILNIPEVKTGCFFSSYFDMILHPIKFFKWALLEVGTEFHTGSFFKNILFRFVSMGRFLADHRGRFKQKRIISDERKNISING